MPPSRLSHGVSRSLLVSLVTLFLVACGGEGGDALTPLTANQTAPNPSIPAAAPSPGLGAATLSWLAPQQNSDGSTLTNLAGFKIYYGQNADALDSFVDIRNASISTYIVENLTRGRWFFGVVAVNSVGVESSLSNVAAKTIT
jgi:hypothetical protein